jgi:hypothetical protein
MAQAGKQLKLDHGLLDDLRARSDTGDVDAEEAFILESARVAKREKNYSKLEKAALLYCDRSLQLSGRMLDYVGTLIKKDVVM